MKKISKIIPIILSLIVVVVSVPIRLNLLLNYIDKETGFYTTPSNSYINYFEYILLFSVIICIFIGIVFSFKNKININETAKKLLGYFWILISLSLLSDLVLQTTNLSSKISLLSLFSIFFLIISIITFGTLSKTLIKGNSFSSAKSVLMLSPTIYIALKLISVFISHQTITGISEYIFEIVFSVSLLLFIFYSSRLIIGENSKKVVFFTSTLSLITFILGASIMLPKAIILLFNLKTQMSYNLIFSDLVFTFYALAFALFIFKNQTKLEK